MTIWKKNPLFGEKVCVRLKNSTWLAIVNKDNRVSRLSDVKEFCMIWPEHSPSNTSTIASTTSECRTKLAVMVGQIKDWLRQIR